MNRPPYRRSDEVAAYTYRTEVYCPACLITRMIAAGDASPAAGDLPAEDVLDQCAEAAALHRTDEASFDSSEFPKVVFLDQVRDADTCGYCHAPL
jgi:hypothetical protein